MFSFLMDNRPSPLWPSCVHEGAASPSVRWCGLQLSLYISPDSFSVDILHATVVPLRADPCAVQSAGPTGQEGFVDLKNPCRRPTGKEPQLAHGGTEQRGDGSMLAPGQMEWPRIIADIDVKSLDPGGQFGQG